MTESSLLRASHPGALESDQEPRVSVEPCHWRKSSRPITCRVQSRPSLTATGLRPPVDSRITVITSLPSLWKTRETSHLFLQCRMSIRTHLDHVYKDLLHLIVSAISLSREERPANSHVSPAHRQRTRTAVNTHAGKMAWRTAVVRTLSGRRLPLLRMFSIGCLSEALRLCIRKRTSIGRYGWHRVVPVVWTGYVEP